MKIKIFLFQNDDYSLVIKCKVLVIEVLPFTLKEKNASSKYYCNKGVCLFTGWAQTFYKR